MKAQTIRVLVVLLSLTAAIRQSLYAVPAYPGVAEVTQPDGKVLRVRQLGDEHFAWVETEDGHGVAKDTDGRWKYTRPVPGSLKAEVMPNAEAGAVNPASLNLVRHVQPDRTLLKQHIDNQKLQTRRPTVLQSGSPSASSATASDTPPDQNPLRTPISGTVSIKNIVILAAFSDHWDSGANTVLSSYGRVATSEYQNLFNQQGYSTESAVGSVRDFYHEVSYGKVTVDSIVTPWVRLPQNEAYYGAVSGSNPDVRAATMAQDAMNAAEAAGFNFAQGDSDGDGWVDCLTIIHSGFGQEQTGNSTNCIWSHQGEIASALTLDGVMLKKYHTEPALRGTPSSNGMVRIGVCCHEMGHFFGLPDLYDYSSQTYGLGSYCLMAYGSWNGGDGKRPSHFSALSKCMLGLVVPQQVHSQSGVSIGRAEDNPVVHMLLDGMSNSEYFLVENRENYGFDNASEIHPGILIYHVDGQSSNNDLSTWAHPLVKVEEADMDNSLGTKATTSEAGDVWTNVSGPANGFRDQTGDQDCNAMMYQSTYYNRADSPASYSYISLSGFSAPGATMTYNANTLRPAVASQSVEGPDFTVTWGACTNASSYELQEGTPVLLASLTDGAETDEEFYTNWSVGGTAHRDATGYRTGLSSYGMPLYQGGKWYSSVQSLTMRNSFKLTVGTQVSFYLMSHVSAGMGYLKCQISDDAGNTWKTLGSYDGYVDPWSNRTYGFAQISALGIASGSTCVLRFLSNFGQAYGWSAFPGYGYAIDDISLTGIEMPSYGNWIGLNSNIAGTSLLVTGRTSGSYGYRAHAFENGAWQPFGSTGVVTVDTGTAAQAGWELYE